ncbi:UNVERIFIED_CONTAM: hypothetical protein K2H54_035546 [Gekko kuhli]
MTSTHLETRGLFEEVAGAMRSHGYRRTPEQLRAKLKRIKAEFFDCLEDWRGIPPRGYRPTNFRLLRELWEQGGRPGWRLRTPNRPPRAPRRLPTPEGQRVDAPMEQDPGEAAGPHDPVVVVSSPTDGEAESSPTDSEAESVHSSGGEQEESTREEASCEEQIPAPQEEVVLVPEEHPRVEISSGTEGEAGEVQVPSPAPRPEPAQPSGQSPWQREAEDLRRTVKRLNYRVGFIERSVKRMRQIMQCSQTTARQRRRQDHQPAHQPSGGQAEQEGPPTGPTV